jgi:hypothetical protein
MCNSPHSKNEGVLTTMLSCALRELLKNLKTLLEKPFSHLSMNTHTHPYISIVQIEAQMRWILEKKKGVLGLIRVV